MHFTDPPVPEGSLPRLRQVIYVSVVVSVVGLTFSIAVSSIALTVAILAWLVTAAYDRHWNLERIPLDYFFLAYIVAEILATILAIRKWDSFVNSRRLLLIMTVYLVGTYFQTEKRAAIAVGLLVTVTAFLSIVELFDYFELHPDRLFLFQHYMTTGGIKMIVLLLAIPFLLHEGTPVRLKLLGALWSIPILLALILTFTRSSWLGFLGGCVTIGILKNRFILPILVLFIILFLLLAPTSLRERAYSIVDPAHEHNVGRVHLWTAGMKIFKDHPIVGVGDSDLHEIYEKYRSPGDIEPGGHLHNNLLMWLVTLGVVGFGALVTLFLRAFLFELSTYRRIKDQWVGGSLCLGALAVFVGFHINGLFEWNFGDQEIIILVWFSVGLVVAMNRLFVEKAASLPSTAPSNSS